MPDNSKRAKRARILLRMKPEEITVEVWLDAYRALFPEKRGQVTIEHDEYMLKPFREMYGSQKMCEVNALQAQAWALQNPSQVRWLHHAWAKAAAFGVAPFNVWAVVELPPRDRPPVRPPTSEELASILATCTAQAQTYHEPWLSGWHSFRTLIEVAAYTGARQSGLRGLRVRDVRLEDARVTVTEKGNKTRTIALPGPAWPALRRQLEIRRAELHRTRVVDVRGRAFPTQHLEGNRLVWIGRRDGRQLTPDGVQVWWRRIRGDFPFGFHSLRHFAATWLAERGVDQPAIAVQLGHVDMAGRPYVELVQRVYDHPSLELAIDRVAKVGTGA